MKLKTELTPDQIKNLTPEQYRAEVDRLMAAEIADFRRTMDSYRGVAIIAPDGTADDADHATWCDCKLNFGA